MAFLWKCGAIASLLFLFWGATGITFAAFAGGLGFLEFAIFIFPAGMVSVILWIVLFVAVFDYCLDREFEERNF